MSKQQLKTTGLGMSLELGLSKRAIGVVVVSLLALTGIVGVSQEAKADTSHCTPGNITLPLDGGDLVIETKAQLMHFSISQDLYRSSDIVLRPSIGDTLDVSDCTWIPVGKKIFDDNDIFIADRPFTGTFDGAGSTVIFQHIADDGNQGFFGWIQNAVVSDLQLEGTMTSDAHGLIGGLAGWAENSEIENSSFRGTVSVEDNSRTGGLVGYALNTSITNSSFEGSVVVEQEAQRAGGLVGYAENSTITNSRSEADVSADEDYEGKLGGLIGYAKNSYIEGSSSTGDIGDVEAAGDGIGGLVGVLESSTVISSHSEGAVSSTGTGVGGFIGEILGTSSVTSSSSEGSVSSTSTRVGGFVGKAGGVFTISESYSTSSVSTTASSNVLVGGFVGEMISSSSTISNSFSTGSVSAGGDTRLGGFVGQTGGSNLVQNSYHSGAVSSTGFSVDNAGLFVGNHGGLVSGSVARSEAAHGLGTNRKFRGLGAGTLTNNLTETTERMRTQSTFTALGWDFENVWVMSESTNSTFQGFPVLRWQDLSSGGGSNDAPSGASGGFSAAPQTTITSSGTSLTVNLNKTRVLRVSGSNLNLVTEARVAGKKATINFAKSNSGILVISELPLLPSGKYTLTLLTPTGLVAAEVEVGIIAKITRLRGIAASGKLSTKVRSVVRKQNLTYASAGTLRCWGVTTSSSASELALAKQKAEAACAYAKKRNPELDVVSSSRTGTGQPARNQAVKLRYLK
jgi:hypothetical protein